MKKIYLLALLSLIFSFTVLLGSIQDSFFPNFLIKSESYDYKFIEKVDFKDNWKPLTGQLSRDGLHMYICALDNQGSHRLVQMKRSSNFGRFSGMKLINGQINERFNPLMATVNYDNNQIVFVHSATNREADNRLYLASRTNPLQSFNDIRPLNELHSSGYAFKYPWISADGLRLYYTIQSGSFLELRYAERNSTRDNFLERGPVVDGFDKISNNLSAQLSGDEKEIFVLSGQNLYYSVREDMEKPFPTPLKIDEFEVEGYVNSITFTNDFDQMIAFYANTDFDLEVLHFKNISETQISSVE
ncbi:MAG: hypothetical protein EA412_07515 [Chitinophagaceae bacterium]|nr:MAG: hypothetical protein EA412_07515 [Chitinophagaceae bacterium]